MPLLASLLLAASGLTGCEAALEAAGYDPSRITCLQAGGAARDTGKRVTVRSVEDSHDPRLEIIWQKPESVPVYELPAQARVFARDRDTGAPLEAAWLQDGRAVLWTATAPGARGYERYPFLPHALHSLGIRPRLESRGLWVFFDSSYRLRADPEYLATRWRQGGVSAIHVAAWHYWETEAARDAWLQKLIETCHRHAILVYAWVELPHVSEKFWSDHPEWREKTATGQDAQLDWRKLMDLTEPACDRAVRQGLAGLAARFDWDGFNLGELYFESLEGAANPARFTPFAPHARQLLSKQAGVDALAALSDRTALPRLLEARADLAAQLQQRWLGALEEERRRKPHLDLVLTHIDDRFDSSMRDKLGADAARLLPVAAQSRATFLIEDPATLWHLGPERYAEIARRYAALGARRQSLAIDLNIVERYQDVYPTRQQTGVELLQLTRTAARNFDRVALYFENSISRADWPLLAGASALGGTREEDGALRVNIDRPSAVRFTGCAAVNGQEWPARNGEVVLLPAGTHEITKCAAQENLPLLADFNGALIAVKRLPGDRLEVEYASHTRAIAVIARDGERRHFVLPAGGGRISLGMDD